jgi:hypothetical protein
VISTDDSFGPEQATFSAIETAHPSPDSVLGNSSEAQAYKESGWWPCDGTPIVDLLSPLNGRTTPNLNEASLVTCGGPVFVPNFVNVALRNSTNSQHLYHATDDVLGQPVLRDTPLAPSDPATTIALVGDENGFGRMTYGFRGGIDTSRTDLNDGDVVDA